MINSPRANNFGSSSVSSSPHPTFSLLVFSKCPCISQKPARALAITARRETHRPIIMQLLPQRAHLFVVYIIHRGHNIGALGHCARGLTRAVRRPPRDFVWTKSRLRINRKNNRGSCARRGVKFCIFVLMVNRARACVCVCSAFRVVCIRFYFSVADPSRE